MQLVRASVTLVCLLIAQVIYAQPYTFTTLPGSAGYADGMGRNARFDHPRSVAVDSTGNLYVADTANHTIRKITPGRVVSTLAGLALSSGSADGVGSAARFCLPFGVAVDSASNVYVADTYNHTIRKVTPSGVVTTLAGVAGSSGSADGTGSDARLCHPYGVAVDSMANIYVADFDNHTIRKITPDGVVTTLAGLAGASGSADGTGSDARFRYPEGVGVDSTGNVYVADTGNHTIRKITPDGVVTTLAGLAGASGSVNGFGSIARFSNPSGLVVNGMGQIYVADFDNHTIRKITPDGVVTTLAGLAGTSGSVNGFGSIARFSNPSGVAVDGRGDVYVADSVNYNIRKITPGRMVSLLAGRTGASASANDSGSNERFNHPRGLAVDSAGNIYVANTANCTVRKIAPGGLVSTLAGLAGSYGSANGTGSNARFNHPIGIAVDGAGCVYVADTDNHTIRKIMPGRMVMMLAGRAGVEGWANGAASQARFNSPQGLAVDNTGNIFVADTYNHTIRKITPGGLVSTLAGLAKEWGSADGTASQARFNCPTDVAVDRAGNVYVADTGNCTIRKITRGRVVSTLAGLAGASGSTDDAGSNARFWIPHGIAVDRAGNVYVADTGNCTIRKITPAGVVSTVAGLVGGSGDVDGTGSNARFSIPYDIAVDTAGNLYVADYNSLRLGRLVSVTPPLLSLSYEATQLILSWPLTASNFVLESSSAPSPAAAWTPLTYPVGTRGASFVVTNSMETGARFYRLRLR